VKVGFFVWRCILIVGLKLRKSHSATSSNFSLFVGKQQQGVIFFFNEDEINLVQTIAVKEVTNAPERCLKTSTSTCLVFNVTLDMMAPINSKKQ